MIYFSQVIQKNKKKNLPFSSKFKPRLINHRDSNIEHDQVDHLFHVYLFLLYQTTVHFPSKLYMRLDHSKALKIYC